MFCMKCGREVSAGQVFCEECLQDMAKHPVHPGTVVQLPKRTEVPAYRKHPRKRVISAEEQVRHLRRLVRGLVISLAVCIVLIALLAYPAFQHLMEDHFSIGQNYSVVTTAPADTTEPSS